MCLILKSFPLFPAMFLLTAAFADDAAGGKLDKQEVVEITGQGPAVLWRYPNDIASRNLYYGSGGKEHAPREGFFTFDKEDLGGTNPKFDVIDDAGVKWKVKLGPEARPETVASRFVWAVGYFADEDYFLPVMRLKDGVPNLRRGRKQITADGLVYAVRLKRPRPHAKKLGAWQWWHSPFTGTRELNGLRVLMAVMNSWDLKDENNAVYQVKAADGPFRLYEVSDLGASFGTPGFGWTKKGSRGNVKAYTTSKWIRNT